MRLLGVVMMMMMAKPRSKTLVTDPKQQQKLRKLVANSPRMMHELVVRMLLFVVVFVAWPIVVRMLLDSFAADIVPPHYC